MEEPFGAAASMLLEISAYAGSWLLVPFTAVEHSRVALGTGNVLKIQNILHACSEHIDVEKDEDKGKDTFQV